eukprot:TRINITY_DN27624_c0_g1_i1.p1 TRINITY_DN27624_c0_g1~~TRINITY_DN27624_c0_g1_i1.p1  ORF type:complete len:119 (-),score=12.85 TRINITY_DN27624_c0_g1_i1:35-391(-)
MTWYKKKHDIYIYIHIHPHTRILCKQGLYHKKTRKFLCFNLRYRFDRHNTPTTLLLEHTKEASLSPSPPFSIRIRIKFELQYTRPTVVFPKHMVALLNINHSGITQQINKQPTQHHTH